MIRANSAFNHKGQAECRACAATPPASRTAADRLSAAAASNTRMFTHDNEFCVHVCDCRFSSDIADAQIVSLQNTHAQRQDVE